MRWGDGKGVNKTEDGVNDLVGCSGPRHRLVLPFDPARPGPSTGSARTISVEALTFHFSVTCDDGHIGRSFACNPTCQSPALPLVVAQPRPNCWPERKIKDLSGTKLWPFRRLATADPAKTLDIFGARRQDLRVLK